MTQDPHAIDAHPPRHRTSASGPLRGFTVTELLVVIAIIAVVIGLVFVVFPKITGGAKAARCQANQRSIAAAGVTYASDNKTRLVSPRTDTNHSAPGYGIFPQANSYRHYWVAAFNSGLPNSNANIVDCKETLAALRNGALWNYLGKSDSYRSPFDPTNRVRSYSMNGFVGVKFHDDSTGGALNQIPTQYRHDTTTMSRVPQPSSTLLTVPEWDRFDLTQCRNWNFNGFLVNPDPDSRYWFDLPALWHEDVVVSFADGATGAIAIKNRELLDADDDGHDFQEPAPALDFHEFRKLMLPGLIN